MSVSKRPRPSLDPRVAWRIVIAGGAFGGFYAARELCRRMPQTFGIKWSGLFAWFLAPAPEDARR